MDQKRILHMIDREKRYITLLADKDLSCHGYWDMGYHQGRLSVLENMVDDGIPLSEPYRTQINIWPPTAKCWKRKEL